MTHIILVIISRGTYWHKVLLLDAQCSVCSREKREGYLVNKVRLGNRRAADETWNYGTSVSDADFVANSKHTAWALEEVTSLSLSFPSLI